MTEREIIKKAKRESIPASFRKYYIYDMNGYFKSMSPIKEHAVELAHLFEKQHPYTDYIIIEIPPRKKP